MAGGRHEYESAESLALWQELTRRLFPEPAKKPAGDTGRHVDALAHEWMLLTSKINRVRCVLCDVECAADNRIISSCPGPVALVTDYHRGETTKSDPPTWSRHEPKPVDPDSLIYNPVTREFE